jgi:hypothetical protein
MSRLPRRKPRNLFDYFADAVLVLSLLGLVTIYVLWSLCHRPGGAEWHIGDVESSSRLVICSRNDRLVVGVYAPGRRGLWGRAGSLSIDELIADPNLVIEGDLFSWGIAAPHWMIALALSTGVMWWVMVWQSRAELKRRQTEGLCRSCGYDIRASDDRCPECGEPLPPLVLRHPVPPTSSIAPAPLSADAT